MSAPILSNENPSNNATGADIADVSILVSPNPANNSDPIDITTRQISRGATNYQTNYIALPGNAFLISANVGIFPGDVNVSVTAEIESMGGNLASNTWAFSCRDAFSHYYPAHLSTKTWYFLTAIANLTIKPATALQGGALAGVFSRPSVSAIEPLANLRVSELINSFDFGIAHISATRPFEQLLALRSAAASLEDIGQSIRAMELHNGILHRLAIALRSVETDGGITANRYSLRSVARQYPDIWLALRSGAVSIEEVKAAIRSIEIVGGEILEVIVDIIDRILDEGR